MTKFQQFVISKLVWFLVAFVIALGFNFLLPRLIPGNPVDTMIQQMMANGGSGVSGEALQKIHTAYYKQFGLDKPMWQQFFVYVGNLFQGNMGTSFSRSPAKVADLIKEALPWTIGLQLPAILVGWIVGNGLGVLSAYKKGVLDKAVFPTSLFLSSMPYYCLSIILLFVFAVIWQILPASGGYGFEYNQMTFTWPFIQSVLQHSILPFLSLIVVFIGGQAVGMRAMSIYELDADYVRFSHSLGVEDNRIIRFIFRNAMLPQITGLALAIGTMVSGALITEVVFSYPGIGTLLFSSIRQSDYPTIQGVTLVIMVAVLLANFLVDISYGLIDPRIRASESGER